MLTLTGTFKSIFSWWTTARGITARRSAATTADRREEGVPAAVADAVAGEEQLFLASLAGLSAEEREQRIARREWYRRLAEHQALIEAEHRAQEDWWK